MHWYFHQPRSGKMGAVKRNDINNAHDAVKYCTNTPKWYKLPKIEYFLIFFFFLGMYWELHRLRSIKMGAYGLRSKLAKGAKKNAPSPDFCTGV